MHRCLADEGPTCRITVHFPLPQHLYTILKQLDCLLGLPIGSVIRPSRARPCPSRVEVLCFSPIPSTFRPCTTLRALGDTFSTRYDLYNHYTEMSLPSENHSNQVRKTSPASVTPSHVFSLSLSNIKDIYPRKVNTTRQPVHDTENQLVDEYFVRNLVAGFIRGYPCARYSPQRL